VFSKGQEFTEELAEEKMQRRYLANGARLGKVYEDHGAGVETGCQLLLSASNEKQELG
jgi:hypothetical protein